MATKKTTAMTKKSSAKRSRSSAKKMTPAARYLRYELTNSAAAGTETSHYLDIARDLSIVNRRLYRQGRDYHIKKITIVSSNTPNGGNRVSFATVPDTWVSRGAWKRGKDTWMNMMKDANVQISGDITGTWSDFKVSLSRDGQLATKLRPMDNGGNNYLLQEWDYSTMVTPDGTTSADEFELHMLGGHFGAAGAWSSVGLIKSYGESRATVNDGDPNVPNQASSDPLVNVFDYGTAIDEVVDLMETENDSPPYSIASYPGDDLNGSKPLITQDTTIVDGRATVGGFNALCGLVEIETTSPLPNDVYSLLVEIAPGNYRGIKADVI